MSGVPDYLIHFIVSANTSTQHRLVRRCKECPMAVMSPHGLNCTLCVPVQRQAQVPQHSATECARQCVVAQGSIAEIRNKSFTSPTRPLLIFGNYPNHAGRMLEFLPVDTPPQSLHDRAVLIPPQMLSVGQTYSAANYSLCSHN